MADQAQERPEYRCGVCGHRWFGRGKKPGRCANPRCKSRQWEREGGEVYVRAQVEGGPNK